MVKGRPARYSDGECYDFGPDARHRAGPPIPCLEVRGLDERKTGCDTSMLQGTSDFFPEATNAFVRSCIRV